MRKFYQNKKLSTYKPLFLLGVLFAFANTNFGQAPAIEWQKCLGGSAVDAGNFIRQTADGGFITAGYSESTDGDVTGNHGGGDIWIVKQSSTGSIEWQKAFGSSGYEIANSIQQTTGGGYIIAGVSDGNGGDVTGGQGGLDYWVIKITSTGDIEWQRTLGGGMDDYAASVQQTADGGYIVSGYTYSNDGDVTNNHGGIAGTADYWIAKLNNLGTVIEWQKTLGGTADDFGESIKQTADGGYIVTGDASSTDGDVTGNHGLNDCWVVKLNSTGSTIEWKRALGGTDADWGNSIQQTTDGGYIVGGYAKSDDGDVTGQHGGGDCWIVKLNSTGSTIEWQKAYGGTLYDETNSIQQTADGGYISGGYALSKNGNVIGAHDGGDYWIIKLSSTGVLEWQKPFGGQDPDLDYSIQQTADGGYVMAGYAVSNNGNVTNNHGGQDAWVVKLVGTPVPLKLLSFTGSLQDKTVKLNWQTTNEENTSHFIIERSSDGKQFSQLQKVNALGTTTSTHSYSITDDKPLYGKSYYRLKPTDKDGKYTYSSIVQVSFGKDGSVTINPNPVKDILNLHWESNSTTKVFIRITDISGRLMISKQSSVAQDKNNISIPVQSLSAGIYMIQLQQGNDVQNIKFVKQ